MVEFPNQSQQNTASDLMVVLQFREVTTARFLASRERRVYLHSIMCDFFLGKWSGGREKTYRFEKK